MHLHTDTELFLKFFNGAPLCYSSLCVSGWLFRILCPPPEPELSLAEDDHLLLLNVLMQKVLVHKHFFPKTDIRCHPGL